MVGRSTSHGAGGRSKRVSDADAVSHVWIPDGQDVWRLAHLDGCSNDIVTVHVPGVTEEPFDLPREHTCVWDPSHALYLEDAAKLNSLHEAALLNLLRTRFEGDDIYTYTGDVLISLNPYKDIPLLYQMPYDNHQAINRRVTAGVARSQSLDEGLDGHESDGDGGIVAGGSGAAGRPAGGGGRAPPPGDDSVLDHPHVYSVADKAHRFMTEAGPAAGVAAGARTRDQSIIITGESGAGKTEAAKYVMRYLIAASQAVAATATANGEQHRQGGNGSKGGGGRRPGMEQCLLESTVVLEAFGNAKTVRNDNSSRFGKYIKLQYGPDWRLRGARTLPFLLEKSRLVHQEKDERGYHVFYQLCKGLPEAEREALALGSARDFEILRRGGVFTQSDEVDDTREFRRLGQALSVLGISAEERAGLWRLLAALLHMGNIQFVDVSAESTGREKVALESPTVAIREIAGLLGLPAGLLVTSIRTKTTVTGRGSWLDIPLDGTQARDNLHALIKHLYGQGFNWLVGKINEAHGGGQEVAGGAMEPAAFIGILDIFGFEIMARNSFEQLCINFANEVLQQQFNSHVFVLEQEEYAREGLDWNMIEFKDNQPVIDLIAKKPTGLLIQLEEQGLLGRRANNKALLQLYHNTHLGTHDSYSKPRFESDEFIVRHFAGCVRYDIMGFLEKNNDSLHDSLLDLLDASEDPFVLQVSSFADDQYRAAAAGGGVRGGSYESEGGPGPHAPLPLSPVSALPSSGNAFTFSDKPGPVHHASHRKIGSRQDNQKARHAASGARNKVSQIATTVTVSRAFRGQLLHLMSTLRATTPHYIKCIKPNNVKAPGGFSPQLVRQQLNYSGVLEVVRIRREAYPGRVPFGEFYERFELLCRRAAMPAAGQVKRTSSGTKAAAPLPGPEAATEAESREACARVLEAFVPEGHYQLGRTRVFLKEDGLDLLRAALRGQLHRSAAKLQALARGWLARRRVGAERAAALRLQAWGRMAPRRRRFVMLCAKVVFLQGMLRASRVRVRYGAANASATAIQAWARVLLARRRLQRARAAAVLLQSLARGGRARREFGELVMLRWGEEAEQRELDAEREEVLRQAKEHRVATRLQAWYRCRMQALRYEDLRLAAVAAQRWVRSCLANAIHARAVRTAFGYARDGNVNGLANAVRRRPGLLFVRDRRDRFKTLLHAAAAGGHTSLASLLDPLPLDVVAVDADGNTALHHAAASCRYDLVKFLAAKANNKVHVPKEEDTRPCSIDLRMLENRASKRVSLRLIAEARRNYGKPRLTVRKGSVLAPVRDKRPGAERNVPTAVEASKPIYQGFLLKRRETGNWQRRWCVLTERNMEYYHGRQDYTRGKKPAMALQLATALLKKSEVVQPGGQGFNVKGPDVSHCFELHSAALLGTGKNKEGRLYFKAESEQELYAWLVPLRVLVGNHSLGGSRVGCVVRHLDVAKRKALVSARNKMGQTPLHFVAKSPASSRADASTIGRVQIGTWLVESGCDVNAADVPGATAVHLSAFNGHIPLASALTRRGGDLSARDASGRSCMDLLELPEDVEAVAVGYYRAAERSPRLPPPVKLAELTYLSLHLEKLTMQSTSGLSSPFIAVTVHDARGQRIEPAQDIIAPVMRRPGYLWWSATWHMQNPVENLGPGSFVVFELRDQSTHSDEIRALGWAVYQVNPNAINTQEVCLEMFESPVDLSLRNLSPADLFLSGDVYLTTARTDLDG